MRSPQHVRILAKCLEPLGYSVRREPGYTIYKRDENGDEVRWEANNAREALAFLAGILEAHPFKVKIVREYKERLNNESMAGKSK